MAQDTIIKEAQEIPLKSQLENGHVTQRVNGYRNASDGLKMTLDVDYMPKNIETFVDVFLHKKLRPEGFDTWSNEKQYEWILKRVNHLFPDTSLYTCNLLVGMLRPSVFDRSPADRPKWLDMDKFRKGQKFAQDHVFGHSVITIVSLVLLFFFKHGIRALIFTRRSHTPYLAFKRYLSTISRIHAWYSGDPWTKGTDAYNELRTVCKMHEMTRKKISHYTMEEFNEMTTIPNPLCPMRSMLKTDFQSHFSDEVSPICIVDDLMQPELNQTEMCMVQFAFVGLVVLYPEEFGIHYATKEDLENFCHMWRGLGYLLGIDDEFNICTGSLEEVQQRSREMIEDNIKPMLPGHLPEWEHMSRCLFEGVMYYVPTASFDASLLHMLELMNIPTANLYANMRWKDWIIYKLNGFVYRYLLKFSFIREYLNERLRRTLQKAVAYTPEKHAELRERSAKLVPDFWIST